MHFQVLGSGENRARPILDGPDSDSKILFDALLVASNGHKLLQTRMQIGPAPGISDA